VPTATATNTPTSTPTLTNTPTLMPTSIPTLTPTVEVHTHPGIEPQAPIKVSVRPVAEPAPTITPEESLPKDTPAPANTPVPPAGYLIACYAPDGLSDAFLDAYAALDMYRLIGQVGAVLPNYSVPFSFAGVMFGPLERMGNPSFDSAYHWDTRGQVQLGTGGVWEPIGLPDGDFIAVTRSDGPPIHGAGPCFLLLDHPSY
jgi:hypothetical protein